MLGQDEEDPDPDDNAQAQKDLAALGDPAGYRETAREQNIVKCCGSGCFIFIGLLSLSWIFHALPVSNVSDIPPFARSLIWMSLAHHTGSWRDYRENVSPPPPSFGDGSGFFAPTQSSNTFSVMNVSPPPPPPPQNYY